MSGNRSCLFVVVLLKCENKSVHLQLCLEGLYLKLFLVEMTFYCFSEKIRLGIACELFARQK